MDEYVAHGGGPGHAPPCDRGGAPLPVGLAYLLFGQIVAGAVRRIAHLALP